jgi:hypothetical protein
MTGSASHRLHRPRSETHSNLIPEAQFTGVSGGLHYVAAVALDKSPAD